MVTAPTTTPEQKTKRLIDDGWEPENAASQAKTMSDRQFASTYNPGYRSANPLDAATRSYDRFNTSISRKFSPFYADNVQPYVSRALNGAGSALNSGYPTASGLGAAGGAGIGILLNFLRNRNSDEEGGYGLAAGLGGVGGAALGALSHYYRDNMSKQAFAIGGQDPYTAVMMDNKLSASEKQMILQAMGRLSQRELQDLKKTIATVVGGGVGVVIMRYLFGKGLLTSAVGALLGGVMGSGMVGSHKLNSLNQYY